MASLLVRSKRIGEDGSIEERVIWMVPKSIKSPDGVRYRLAFIRKGEKGPTVLYDNHHPKGHHKHIRRKETSYGFVSVEQLLFDFKRDVEEAKKQ